MDLCIIKRSSAMGDVLLSEPFIRYMSQFYRIWFQTNPKYISVLENTPFIEKIITIYDQKPNCKFIDLDMTYEHHLDVPIQDGYFKHFGFVPNISTQYKIYFSPKEIYQPQEKTIVVDIGYPGCRQYYTNWQSLFTHIFRQGYKIFLIGDKEDPRQFSNVIDYRQNILTIRETFCLINNSELFIGVDSGPLHVAKTLGKKGIGIYCAYSKITSQPFENTQLLTYDCTCLSNLQTTCGMKCIKSCFDVDTIIKYFNVLIGTYNGQACQDYFVLHCHKFKKNGTFLEIGSSQPVLENNTFILEKVYRWKGIMVEMSTAYVEQYKSVRCNSVHLIQDACSIDYKTELKKCFGEQKFIDYLQVDLDVDNHSTLSCLYNLDRNVFDEYKFAVVTFEHDIYRGNYFDTMKISREIFEKRGYKRVFSNVCLSGLDFEDWYIHPDLITLDISGESMDCKNIIKLFN